MAALYKGARIIMDKPKVRMNNTNKKYRYMRMDACFIDEIVISSYVLARIFVFD